MGFNNIIYKDDDLSLFLQQHIQALIPDGWKFVKVDKVKEGDWFLQTLSKKDFDVKRANKNWNTMKAIIVRKIEKKRIVTITSGQHWATENFVYSVHESASEFGGIKSAVLNFMKDHPERISMPFKVNTRLEEIVD